MGTPDRWRRWGRHAVARSPQYVFVLLAAATLTFSLPRLMPGDPVLLLLGEDAALLPQDELQSARAEAGLDRPLPVQYVGYLRGLAEGDLGQSYHWQRPVADLLADRLPWTLLLLGSAALTTALLGVAAGLFSAWRRGRRSDAGALAGFLVLESIPSFWLGLLLLILFGANLGWFPIFGATTAGEDLQGWVLAMDVARHVALPLATLTLASVGGMFLVTRYALLNVIREDYVDVARAKGLRETTIAVRHALPAAALPIVTTLFLRLGFLVGGTVVVETVFSYPGVGRLMFEAALGRDHPVLQGGFFVLAFCVIAANLAADLTYPLLDPRIGTRQAARS